MFTKIVLGGCLGSLVLLTCVATTEQRQLPHDWTDPSTGIEFVRIESGTFLMGTPETEFGREEQETLHSVELTAAFYLGRHEVTQAQWQKVMGSNPSHFRDCGGNCPIETVSYREIERFLTTVVEGGGPRLRLPSEAEWEYACRAGTTTAFAYGSSLTTEQANFDGTVPYPGETPGRNRQTPTPVGTFLPNAWGLFDMHGNVWEWTRDEHCPYSSDMPGDPRAVTSDPRPACGASLLVIRGGSWHFGPDSARCGLRYTHRPQDDGPSLGFRVAIDATEVSR